MHPIKRYCRRQKITQREFAMRVGLSEGFISQLIRGHERCGRDAALRIVEASGEGIRLRELLEWSADGAGHSDGNGAAA